MALEPTNVRKGKREIVECSIANVQANSVTEEEQYFCRTKLMVNIGHIRILVVSKDYATPFRTSCGRVV